jgi:hypothetical protein
VAFENDGCHSCLGCPTSDFNFAILAGYIGIRPGVDMEVDRAGNQTIDHIPIDMKMLPAEQSLKTNPCHFKKDRV